MKTQTIHYLTQEELKRLLKQVASKRDKALILLAYSYGLRASEISLLRREDIDFARLKIRIQRVKGSISAEYPLRPEVAKALKSYLRTRKDNSPILFPSKRGLPINRRTLDYLMKRYGKLAGIPKEKRHFHVLKHSIATHLLDAGADIIFVKDWLGHKNIQNTIVYSQLTSRTREEQARKVFASPRIV
jgi:integrase